MIAASRLQIPRVLGKLLPEFKPAKSGTTSIERNVIHAGEPMWSYDPYEGRMIRGIAGQNFHTWRLVVRDDDRIQQHWMDTSMGELNGLVLHLLHARGRVLTSGLGMGLFAHAAAHMLDVAKVTAVEASQDVINVVGPQVSHEKLCIVRSTIENYAATTQERFDFVYLDIWESITGPLLDVRKYTDIIRPVLSPGGEVRFWLGELIDRVLHRLPKGPLMAPPRGNFGPMAPCLVCGKTLRHDYGGVCMDCADGLGISELFIMKDSHDAP